MSISSVSQALSGLRFVSDASNKNAFAPQASAVIVKSTKPQAGNVGASASIASTIYALRNSYTSKGAYKTPGAVITPAVLAGNIAATRAPQKPVISQPLPPQAVVGGASAKPARIVNALPPVSDEQSLKLFASDPLPPRLVEVAVNPKPIGGTLPPVAVEPPSAKPFSFKTLPPQPVEDIARGYGDPPVKVDSVNELA